MAFECCGVCMCDCRCVQVFVCVCCVWAHVLVRVSACVRVCKGSEVRKGFVRVCVCLHVHVPACARVVASFWSCASCVHVRVWVCAGPGTANNKQGGLSTQQ